MIEEMVTILTNITMVTRLNMSDIDFPLCLCAHGKEEQLEEKTVHHVCNIEGQKY